MGDLCERAAFDGLATPAAPFDDSAAIGDGQNYHYLVVDVSSGMEGTFGRNSLLALRPRPRPRPADSATDLVISLPVRLDRA